MAQERSPKRPSMTVFEALHLRPPRGGIGDHLTAAIRPKSRPPGELGGAAGSAQEPARSGGRAFRAISTSRATSSRINAQWKRLSSFASKKLWL